MANGNKLLDQKAIDTIIDSILKAVEIKLNKKSSEGRGKDGKDGKDGRDGKNAPQINDDEALSTNPWSGLKTQEAIAKVEGKIYPCTAQALEDMSREQQAELYTQGYRAIKTENNGTVVLLGLGSDGSLEWLGCNQPRGNLLDNSNFAIAQAGYGGTHGTQVYAADRWKGSGTGATFAAGSGGGLSITCGTGSAGCTQVIANPPAVGAYFSFVVVSGNTTVIASGTWTGTEQDATATSGMLTATVNAGSVQISIASGSATVDYCMLLEGGYTPKTLPPWEAPDYTMELLTCQRYAVSPGPANNYYPYTQITGSVIDFLVPIPIEMRIIPTLSAKMNIYGANIQGVQTGFTFSVTGMGNGSLTIRATKSNHGLTGAFLSINGLLSSDL